MIIIHIDWAQICSYVAGTLPEWEQVLVEAHLSYLSISRYENGRLEPPLPILLRYARLIGVIVDVLIDDEQELPKREKGNR